MSEYNNIVSVPLTDEQLKLVYDKMDEYRTKYAKRISRAEAVRLIAFGNGDASNHDENVSPPGDDTNIPVDKSAVPEDTKKDGWSDLKLDF